jgi:glycosyltransferase involved in cell wall biosynthesis
MKIAIIGPFPKPINGCSLANEILARQLRFNKNISISTINTNTENISSENVGHFSFKKVFSFLKVYKNVSIIKKSDIIYTTPGQTFFGVAKYIPFYFYCLLYKKQYIIHIHGNHLGNEYKSLTGIKKWFFSYFIKKASSGIVLSNSLRNNFEGLLNQDKVFVVENFAQDELTQNLELNKSNNKLQLLYLSNLMEEKGILDFLDSLLLLKKANIDFTADIAGKIEDESQVTINNKLDELGDLVKYHGVVFGKNKIGLLQKSNVFVLPTYYKMEGQPIALIEAMATGNIIVTTNFSGIPDIISNTNGYFVMPKNPKSIFDVLLIINNELSNNINHFSAVNVEYVKSNFTEAKFSGKILEIINQVIKSNV